MNVFIAIGSLCIIALMLLMLIPKRDDNDKNIKNLQREEPQIPELKKYIDGEVYPKKLLMDYEQEYYFRIYNMIPENTLLHTQVSFSAFLKSSEVRTRNSFNRSHADLIISDLNFNVLLICEIDGSSHRSSRVKERDRKRDAITSSAGIPTLRIDDSYSDQEIYDSINEIILERMAELKKSA